MEIKRNFANNENLDVMLFFIIIYRVVIIKITVFRPTYSPFSLTDIDASWNISYMDFEGIKSAIKK